MPQVGPARDARGPGHRFPAGELRAGRRRGAALGGLGAAAALQAIGEVVVTFAMGKPWENHGKTMGKPGETCGLTNNMVFWWEL